MFWWDRPIPRFFAANRFSQGSGIDHIFGGPVLKFILTARCSEFGHTRVLPADLPGQECAASLARLLEGRCAQCNTPIKVRVRAPIEDPRGLRAQHVLNFGWARRSPATFVLTARCELGHRHDSHIDGQEHAEALARVLEGQCWICTAPIAMNVRELDSNSADGRAARSAAAGRA